MANDPYAFSGKQPAPLSDADLETLRKRAWQEQGILIVSPHDPRLSFFDKALLSQVGNRLYAESESNENQ